MGLEHTSHELPPVPASPLLESLAVQVARDWQDRAKALLVVPPTEASLNELGVALDAVQLGCRDGREAAAGLAKEGSQADGELLNAVQVALAELDGREQTLRDRLTILEPVESASRLDLDGLREKLAAAAARRELAAVAGKEAPNGVLELPVAPPDPKTAWSIVRSVVICTTLLVVLPYWFFGGMYEPLSHVFLRMLGCTGPLLVGLVLMTAYSLRGCVSERLRVVGSELTIYRKLAGVEWSKTCKLGSDSKAYLAPRDAVDGKGGAATIQVAVTDRDGKECALAVSRPLEHREALVKRLNEHFQTLRI